MEASIIGAGFRPEVMPGASGSTLYKKNNFLKWSFENYDNKKIFFVDDSIKEGLLTSRSDKELYGWILESPAFTNSLVKEIILNLKEYKKVFKNIIVNRYDLVKKDPKFFIWAPANGSWIDSPKIYKKSKNCSYIASSKNHTALGNYRNNLMRWALSNDNIDCYGKHVRPIDKKEDGLADYRFSIAIENYRCPGYFTEKILDCFATGTIPIYIGDPDIGKKFNDKGIIKLTENFDWSILTPELYDKLKFAVEENYNKMLEMDILDDWIYKKYLK